MSGESLAAAREGCRELGVSNIDFFQGDAENLPFGDSSFDFGYCIGVLHHSPDTQKGIDELYRVVKPGGRVAVMLYHKYTPKWFATMLLRAFSAAVDKLAGRKNVIADRIRRGYERDPNPDHGTALLELFGCPILKTFSARHIRGMFRGFEAVEITCHQSGFERLTDFFPARLKVPAVRRALGGFDRMTRNVFGFYAVIMARKPMSES